MTNISTKINKYIFKNEDIQYVINNFDYFTNEYKFPENTPILERHDEKAMISVIKSLDKNKSIIDIGGNCGLFCIPASMLGYKVYTFEPITINVDLLEMNKKANNCESLEIIQKALFNETKKETIYIPYCSDNTSLNKNVAISNMNNKDYIEETIDCIKFDTWLENKVDLNIGLIKIDVQGFEFNVLNGMLEFLSSAKDLTLIIEWDDKHTKMANNSLTDMHELLVKLGFVEKPFLYNDKIFYKE
jgi:FkbM family methyltransferase